MGRDSPYAKSERLTPHQAPLPWWHVKVPRSAYQRRVVGTRASLRPSFLRLLQAR